MTLHLLLWPLNPPLLIPPLLILPPLIPLIPLLIPLAKPKPLLLLLLLLLVAVIAVGRVRVVIRASRCVGVVEKSALRRFIALGSARPRIGRRGTSRNVAKTRWVNI